MKRTYFNWSTGKDSALALHYLLQDSNVSVEHLVTSVNAYHNRVSMHGLQRSLMLKQVESIQIKHSTIELPKEPTMEEYSQLMEDFVKTMQKKGIEYSGFGDIFLEDLKKYREDQLEKCGMKAVFPLWKQDTTQLFHDFLSLGFKAIVVCINADVLDESFVGRILDQSFLDDLPENVDPCGENGEYHTFCFDGPIFSAPIQFEIGERVFREYPSPSKTKKNIGFWFCDLIG